LGLRLSPSGSTLDCSRITPQWPLQGSNLRRRVQGDGRMGASPVCSARCRV